MSLVVCSGAILKCSFGTLPSSLNVLPVYGVMGKTPIATIMDNKPFINIFPFGLCTTLSNPATAAATAAAAGVFTPAPCIPAIVAPWILGNPKILIKNFPILTMDSKLMCMWGGIIQPISPGQFQIFA